MNYETAAIVLVILLAAYVGYQALGSSWGSAVWKTMGFFGALLGAFLRNPLLWLIGAGLLYLLGPAILSISASALKDFFDKVTAAASAEAELAPEDRLSPAERAVVVEKLRLLAESLSVEQSRMDAAEKANAIAEAQGRYASAVSAAVESGEITAPEADAAESFADDVWAEDAPRAVSRRAGHARRAGNARRHKPVLQP